MIAGPEHVAKVAAIYEAFGAGDVGAIVRMVTEDVDWGAGVDPSIPGAAEVPNFGRFHGPGGVVAYFTAVAETYDFQRFTPVWITTANDEVVSLISFELTMKATGRQVALEEIHRFRFDADGRIDRLRPHLDTATLFAAALP